MKLLGKRLLLEAVTKTALGIEEIDYYKVAFIGDEFKKSIKIGDKVHFYQGIPTIINGQKYQLVTEEEVIVIL